MSGGGRAGCPRNKGPVGGGRGLGAGKERLISSDASGEKRACLCAWREPSPGRLPVPRPTADQVLDVQDAAGQLRLQALLWGHGRA